jgi:hypothetical protein
MPNTHFAWPLNSWPAGFPVSGSHIRTVLSIEHVASCLPSGLQLTPKTHPVCPFNVCFGVPESVSQMRAVLSPLPVARRLELTGENWQERIGWP